MGAFEILALIISLLATGAGIASQHAANQQNINFANLNREDQQAYNAEQAELANKRNIENYLRFQSPRAQMQQLREAGLSPGLFYGYGGTGGSVAPSSTATSGIAGAPVIQPIVSAMLASQALEAMKSKSEIESTESGTKRTEQETENLKATYENIIANTKNTEAQTKLVENQTKFSELTNKMAEIETKYKEAKELKELETMGAELTKAIEEGNRLMEEVKGLQIENKYKEELTLKQIEELDERIRNICEDTILKHKEALRAEAAKNLDQKQLENFDKNIEQLEESINSMKADQGLKKEEERGKKLENDWFEAQKFLKFFYMVLKVLAN